VLVFLTARVEAHGGFGCEGRERVDLAVFDGHKLELKRKASTRGSIFAGRSRAASLSFASIGQSILMRQRYNAIAVLHSAFSNTKEAG
jgi:hypothetical protein